MFQPSLLMCSLALFDPLDATAQREREREKKKKPACFLPTNILQTGGKQKVDAQRLTDLGRAPTHVRRNRCGRRSVM